MANKRKLHHFHTKLRPVKARYLLLVFLVSLGIGVYALRQNNLRAIELRDQVIAADKANKGVEEALRNLREHTYSHMNSSLSSGSTSIKQPIQLKYTYERLVAAEKERVSKNNEKIYAEAQVTCERLFPVGLSGSGRIPCIQDYVAKNGTTEQPIQDALYKFDFASPIWSPDLAGFALLVAAISGVLFVTKVALDRWLKSQIHDHL